MVETGIGRRFAQAAWSHAQDRKFRTKAMSFAVIGLFNAGVDYGVFTLAFLVFGWRIIFANFLAWAVAVTCSYVLNSTITFAAESGRVLRLRDYLTFVASGIAGFLANTITVVLLSYVLPVLVAKVIALGASFAVNFTLSHFVVFKPRQPVSDSSAQP